MFLVFSEERKKKHLEIKVHKNEVLLIKWELNTFVHGGSKSRWK